MGALDGDVFGVDGGVGRGVCVGVGEGCVALWRLLVGAFDRRKRTTYDRRRMTGSPCLGSGAGACSDLVEGASPWFHSWTSSSSVFCVACAWWFSCCSVRDWCFW